MGNKYLNAFDMSGIMRELHSFIDKTIDEEVTDRIRNQIDVSFFYNENDKSGFFDTISFSVESLLRELFKGCDHPGDREIVLESFNKFCDLFKKLNNEIPTRNIPAQKKTADMA